MSNKYIDVGNLLMQFGAQRNAKDRADRAEERNEERYATEQEGLLRREAATNAQTQITNDRITKADADTAQYRTDQLANQSKSNESLQVSRFQMEDENGNIVLDREAYDREQENQLKIAVAKAKGMRTASASEMALNSIENIVRADPNNKDMTPDEIRVEAFRIFKNVGDDKPAGSISQTDQQRIGIYENEIKAQKDIINSIGISTPEAVEKAKIKLAELEAQLNKILNASDNPNKSGTGLMQTPTQKLPFGPVNSFQ